MKVLAVLLVFVLFSFGCVETGFFPITNGGGGGSFDLNLAILKNGTTVTTASIPFAEGIRIMNNKVLNWGLNGHQYIFYDSATDRTIFSGFTGNGYSFAVPVHVRDEINLDFGNNGDDGSPDDYYLRQGIDTATGVFNLRGFATSSTNVDGLDVNISAGDGHTFIVSSQNGGILSLWGGQKTVNGNHGYVSVGSGTPSHPTNTSSLYVQKDIEVDGNLFSDSNAHFRDLNTTFLRVGNLTGCVHALNGRIRADGNCGTGGSSIDTNEFTAGNISSSGVRLKNFDFGQKTIYNGDDANFDRFCFADGTCLTDNQDANSADFNQTYLRLNGVNQASWTPTTTVVTNLNADLLDGKTTGTSGNTVPLLDGTNTWSANQTLSKAIPAWFWTDSGGDDYTIDVGSTASLLRIRNTTDGTTPFQIDGDAKISMSSNYAPNTNQKVYITDRITDPTTNVSKAALSSTLEILHSSADWTGTSNMHGYTGGVVVYANTRNFNTDALAIGLRGDSTGFVDSGNRIQNLVGLFGASNLNRWDADATGTATNGYGFNTFISTQTNVNIENAVHYNVGGTQNLGDINNLYGVKIDELTTGINRYEIFLGGGGGLFFRDANTQFFSPSTNRIDLNINNVNTINLTQGNSRFLTDINADKNIVFTSGTLRYTPSNKCAGLTSLVAGTATITSTCADGNYMVLITNQASAGTVGQQSVGTKAQGSFVISSLNISDTSSIYWEIRLIK